MTSTISPSSSLTASSLGITNGIRGEVDHRHPFEDLISKVSVEVNPVGFEQIFRRLVISLRLDPLDLAQQLSHALPECVGVGHHLEGLSVADSHVDGVGVIQKPVHDYLTVAHVVFLEL